LGSRENYRERERERFLQTLLYEWVNVVVVGVGVIAMAVMVSPWILVLLLF
jgi:hypothetical protein